MSWHRDPDQLIADMGSHGAARSGLPAAIAATVLIPTYNRAGFLAQTIASVLAQSVSAERILVIDDGSSDHTPQTVAAFGPNVDYLRKPNGGKASALNAGLQVCTTEFVWIIDDDDIVAPDALQRLVGPLLESQRYGFSFGYYQTFTEDADGRRSFTDVACPPLAPGEIFIASLNRVTIHHPGLLVRKSCYDAIGPFDESLRFSEDFDMLLRLGRHFAGIEVNGGPVFFQRQHDGPRSPGGKPVAAQDRGKAWKPYNQRILRKHCAEAPLEAFVAPPVELPLTDGDRFAAYLRRCVALARRGLWDDAAAELRQAAALPAPARLDARQTQILQALFDPWSEGAQDFPGAHDFRAVLAGIRPRALAADMRLAMVWCLPYLIRRGLRRRDLGEAASLARTLMQLAPAPVLVRLVTRKLAGRM